MPAEEVTSDQAAAVFRRAAELDQNGAVPARSNLDLAALEQAGLEAGLSRESIRQALAEVKAGAVAPQPTGHAAASRTVDMRADKVEHWVKDYMRQQGFRVVRDLGNRAVWAPDRSLATRVRRAMDFNKRMVLREVNQVTTTVVSIPGDERRSHVRFELDLGAARWAWRVLPITFGAMGIAGVAVVGALVAPGWELVVAPGAVAITGGAYAGARAGFRSSVRRSLNGVELFLDRLEHHR